MKIRHPALLAAGGFAVSIAVNVLVGSIRYRMRWHDPDVNPHRPGQDKRFIYAFWHDALLLPAFHYSRTPTKVLISEHADGEMIAQACRQLGLGSVRGSTTRGGVQAMREILGWKGKYHLVITPDGPRGPRRQVQPGLIYLASRTGLPIVPVGFGYRRAWRMPSWDQLAVPMPFSPAVGVSGPTLSVPPRLGRGELETQRVRVEAALQEATRLAEGWAAREEW